MNNFSNIYEGKYVSRNELLETIFKDQSQKYELYQSIVNKINENENKHEYYNSSYEKIIMNRHNYRSKYLKIFTKNEVLLIDKIQKIFRDEYYGSATVHFNYNLNGVSRIACRLCYIDYDDSLAIEYCKNNIKKFYEYCVKLSKNNFFKELFNSYIYVNYYRYGEMLLKNVLDYRYNVELPEHLENIKVNVKISDRLGCTLEEYFNYDLIIGSEDVNFCNVFMNQDILMSEPSYYEQTA